jgi:hypothetical protein
LTGHVFDRTIANELCVYEISEVLSIFASLSFPFRADWNDFADRVYVTRNLDGYPPSLVFVITVIPEKWAQPYTIPEYESALLAAAATSTTLESIDTWNLQQPWPDDNDEQGSGVSWPLAFVFPISSSSNTIREEIFAAARVLQEFFDAATRAIIKSRPNGAGDIFRVSAVDSRGL